MGDMFEVLRKYEKSGKVAQIHMKPGADRSVYRCIVIRSGKKFVTINPVDMSDSAIDLITTEKIHYISDINGNIEYVANEI
jgi:type II secretory pathway component PulC